MAMSFTGNTRGNEAGKAQHGHWLVVTARRLAPAFFHVVAAMVVLGSNPFVNQTITPFDELANQKAWAFVDPGVKVRQGQRSDTLNYFVPMWTVARNQIRAGECPLWNDKVAGGGPMLNVSTGIFTPAFVLFAATPDPPLGFYLGILITLAIAGLGMHVFLRRHFCLSASVVGAITFEFCGFNAAWLYWPHVFTLIWAPWLLWAIQRCVSRPGAGSGLLIAAFTALTCLGGFPFISVLVLEAGALYALILWLHAWRSSHAPWPLALWYVAGTTLGLLVTTIPLLGLAYWLHEFDIGYREGRGSYLNLHYWKQLFPPWAWQTRRVEQTMYVGIVMTILAVASLGTIVMRLRRVKPEALFAALLLVITFGLVFDLWPMWLIGWMPGMSYNAWSRAIGLMDLSLILLGVMALDWFWIRGEHAGWQRAARGAMAFLAIVQIAEIAMFFHAFNGPVPRKDYFPQTPTITYMQKHTGPFDYVISDKSFLMSGTLQTYGLREWLGHYFRSPSLQRVLHQMARHPFYSHVASPSRFAADDIKYDSPALAAYNVRFAAIDAAQTPVTTDPIVPVRSTKHVALPPMPMHGFAQWFTVSDQPVALQGMAVRFGTYRQTDLPGTIAVTMSDVDGNPVATGNMPARDVVDNTYLYFPFQRTVKLAPAQYSFSVLYRRPRGSNQRLTAWTFAAPTPGARLVVDGKPHAGSIDFKLYAAPAGVFRRVFASAGTAVLENTRSPGGPYYLPAITDYPAAAAASGVQVTDYRPSRFVLRYAGLRSGFVIVPMTGNDDWKVRVNGVATTYPLKDGVMPAIPVTGPSTISFNYHPRALHWLVPWLVALAAVLIGMLWLDRRLGHRV